jgi:hypothetical protein
MYNGGHTLGLRAAQQPPALAGAACCMLHARLQRWLPNCATNNLRSPKCTHRSACQPHFCRALWQSLLGPAAILAPLLLLCGSGRRWISHGCAQPTAPPLSCRSLAQTRYCCSHKAFTLGAPAAPRPPALQAAGPAAGARRHRPPRLSTCPAPHPELPRKARGREARASQGPAALQLATPLAASAGSWRSAGSTGPAWPCLARPPSPSLPPCAAAAPAEPAAAAASRPARGS